MSLSPPLAPGPDASPLRFVTWLAPSLPLELFAAIAGSCGRILGAPVTLESITDLSGPTPGTDPLRCGDADVGFLCPPTYRRLREQGAPVELLAAPVFADPRCGGRAVYFSELIVPARSPARRLDDLRGGAFAYNDPSSLSGWECLVRTLAARGERLDFFDRYPRSGSHLASLELVARGHVDAAAIDSNALALALARAPRLAGAIRVIESWGPWPVQPVAVRAGLDPAVKDALRAALLGLHEDPAARAALAPFGVERFVPARECDYLEALVPAAGPVSGPASAPFSTVLAA